MRYIDMLFPKLAASGLQLELFYEVKSNLRYDQLVKMHRGGMRQIQPGIESFSNHVLRLMDKGVTGFQNIQLMRWCKEIGIECAWNVLAGFPGESESDYASMAALIPLLTHLDPPCSCAQVRLDRFSPFHTRAAQFGFRKLRPARAYFYVFPLGRRELDRLAYFFDFDYEDNRQPDAYLEPVQRAVQRWWRSRSADPAARLDARFDDDGNVEVIDTRETARRSQFRLTAVRAKVFALCDVAMTAAALARHPDLAGLDVDVQAALDSLVADGLMAHEAGHYLTLAVFRNRLAGLPAVNSHAHDTTAQTAAARSLLPLV
jgi:ribosomal peptide maturation radical SAM protein 1